MRLAAPVYESLPYAYVGLGTLAMLLSYLDAGDPRAVVSFGLGLMSQVAGVTIYLHRQDCRALRNQYSREIIEDPAAAQEVASPSSTCVS